MRAQAAILAECLENVADDLSEVAPQHRIRDLDRVDILFGEPGPPAFVLLAQHRHDVGDRAGVVLGAGVPSRIGPPAPDPGLHGTPERNRLGDSVGPVDVDQDRIAADDVADRGEKAVAGSVGQARGALQQQRGLVPHQLAAPYPVGGAADGPDVVTPDLGRRKIGLAFVQRIQQSQDRFVLDACEPLPRLRRHAGGGQVLEELLRLTRHAGRPQRFDEQRAAAALRREHQISRRMG